MCREGREVFCTVAFPTAKIVSVRSSNLMKIINWRWEGQEIGGNYRVYSSPAKEYEFDEQKDKHVATVMVSSASMTPPLRARNPFVPFIDVVSL